MVDFARPPEVLQRRKIRRAAYVAAGLTAVLLITVGVSRLKPAAPDVQRGTLWFGKVERGPMVRQVRGTGTLVPIDIVWIPAAASGRVDRILLRPGAPVKPDTVILDLSNPELEQQVLDAELQARAATARLQKARADLTTQLLTQEATLAQVEAAYEQAKGQAEADARLRKEGLQSELQTNKSASTAAATLNQLNAERRRLEIMRKNEPAQLAEQEADVKRLQTMYDLRRQQLQDLAVKSGVEGVLQLVPVEVGAQVAQGANVARVANPSRLKAEIRIPETQAQDIQLGQRAEVDTRNGIAKGKVSRIDPAAANGTVTVDVALEGELPRGARPDLTVDGTIELERLDNVVYVGRPAIAPEQGTVRLFKVLPNGEAVAVQVRLGRSSVNTIEVLDGLRPGDEVVLSDMSQWDDVDRIRLN
jgi:HlyD family secretion protein